MAEDLTDYLLESGVRTRYLHSEVDTLERIKVIRELRLGDYDVLVGVNLLREGLDLPEVSLVAILDADKEGFLRGQTALIQTIGRAARNVNGRVIMYADKMTEAIRRSSTMCRPGRATCATPRPQRLAAARTWPPVTPRPTRSRPSSTGSPPRRGAARCSGCRRAGAARAAAAGRHARGDGRLLRARAAWPGARTPSNAASRTRAAHPRASSGRAARAASRGRGEHPAHARSCCATRPRCWTRCRRCAGGPTLGGARRAAAGARPAGAPAARRARRAAPVGAAGHVDAMLALGAGGGSAVARPPRRPAGGRRVRAAADRAAARAPARPRPRGSTSPGAPPSAAAS